MYRETDIFIPDEQLRNDEQVLVDMERRYKSQRGRQCEFGGCDVKVRYSKMSPFCGEHEDSTQARIRTLDPRTGIDVPGLPRERMKRYPQQVLAADASVSSEGRGTAGRTGAPGPGFRCCWGWRRS